MKIDWLGLRSWWATAIPVFFLLLSITANFTQILTVKNEALLLVSLGIVTLAYAGWQWYNRRKGLEERLNEARDFIVRKAERGAVVQRCAKIQSLLGKHGLFSHVMAVRDHRVELDISLMPVEYHESLLGMDFEIRAAQGGRKLAQGKVTAYTVARATLELSAPEKIHPSDFAFPIEPSDTTDLERMLAEILFILED
jgi:hypothetical protein